MAGYEDHRRAESSGSWRDLLTRDARSRSRVRAPRRRHRGSRAQGRRSRADALRAPVRRHARRRSKCRADEMRDGGRRVAPDVRRAIRQAARHIARVAFRQIPKHWDLAVAPGVSIEQRVEPLARVGCYVPGGRFPLPSSLLMTAVPARVAGVREVIAVCPRPEPVVMAAALEAGVTRLFRIGGAHAVAALAFGTATIPRVDKIVGPGNRYVAAAKATSPARARSTSTRARPRSSSSPAPAGRTGSPRISIAQAEHDPDARSILITWSRALAARVARAVSAGAEGRDDRAALARRARRHRRHPDRGRGHGAGQPDRARTSRRRSRVADAASR